MSLDDRDYMRPAFTGRRPPGFLARLRFALWLLARRLRGRRGSRTAPDSAAAGQEESGVKRI